MTVSDGPHTALGTADQTTVGEYIVLWTNQTLSGVGTYVLVVEVKAQTERERQKGHTLAGAVNEQKP